MPNPLPLQLLPASFAGWTDRHQALATEQLLEENGRLLPEIMRASHKPDDQSPTDNSSSGHWRIPG